MATLAAGTITIPAGTHTVFVRPEMRLSSEVWIIETIDYGDNRSVFGVAVTPEVALTSIREHYGPPYIVAWEEPKRRVDYRGGPDEWELWGQFDSVPCYCTSHRAGFCIYATKLLSGTPAES